MFGLIPIAAQLFGSVGAGAIASALGQIAIGVGMSVLSNMLAGNAQQPEQGVVSQQTFQGERVPQNLALGRFYTKGHVLAPYYAVDIGNNDVPNSHRIQIRDIADAPIRQLTRIWVQGTEFVLGTDLQGTFSANGNPATPNPATRKEWTESQNNLYFDYFRGKQTVASAYLVGKLGNHPERAWTENHIGTGVPYAWHVHRYDTDVYSGEPDVAYEGEGAPVYDPRLDTTAGGTGPHRVSDTATWAYSENPITLVGQLLLGYPLADGTSYGYNVAPGDLPFAEWAAAADACDDIVDGEAQYRAGLIIPMAKDQSEGMVPADAVRKLLDAAAAEVCDQGGRWRVRVGGPGLPLATITDADVVVSSPQDLDPYRTYTERHNACRVRHPDPDQQWNMVDSPLRENAEAVARDGELKSVVVDLPACFSHGQAQRVAQAVIDDDQRQRRHVITLPPEYGFLAPLDAIAWTSARNIYNAKVFEIEATAIDPDTLAVTVSMRERDPDDYDPNITLLPTSAPSSQVISYGDFTLPGADAEAVTVKDAAGNDRGVGIKIKWLAGVTGVKSVAYEIRLQGAATPVVTGSSSNILLGEQVEQRGILPDQTYDVYVWGVDQVTAVTGPIAVTTADARLTALDIDVAITDAIAATDAAVATLEAATEAALGIDLDSPTSLAQQVIDAYGPLTTGDPLAGRVAVLETDVTQTIGDIERLDVTSASNQLQGLSTADAVAQAEAALVQLMLDLAEVRTDVTDAGLYIDPATGKATLEGINRLGETITRVALDLDALAGTVSLSATLTDVNNAIAAAVLDPTDLAALTDLQAQINAVALELDAVAATLTGKAEATTVDALDVRTTSAELRLDGLDGTVALLATSAELGEVDARVTTAEATLSTFNGAQYSVVVSETYAQAEAINQADVTSIEALLQAHEDRQFYDEQIAYARQDLSAKITEGEEATAALRTELGVSFDTALAAIATESAVRASETLALAQDYATLDVRLGDAETGLSGAVAATTALTGRVEQTEAGLVAEGQRIDTIDVRLDDAESDIAGQAAAASVLEGRVTETEAGLEVAANERTVLTAQNGNQDGAIEAADIRALVQAHEEFQDQSVALADARRDLSAQVTAEREARATEKLELTAAIDGAVALVDQEATARAAADEAEAALREALTVRVGDAEAQIVAETVARVTADEAEAAARQALAVQLGDAETAIVNEATVRAAQDAAQAAQIAALSAVLGDAEAGAFDAVVVDVQATQAGLVALASNVFQLQTNVNDNVAAINAVNSVQSDQISAIGARTTTLEATSGDLVSSLTTAEAAIADIEGYQAVTYSMTGSVSGASFSVTGVATGGNGTPAASKLSFAAGKLEFLAPISEFVGGVIIRSGTTGPRQEIYNNRTVIYGTGQAVIVLGDLTGF